MVVATLSALWAYELQDTDMSPRGPRRRAPLFIGDAVQPFGGETLLLALLRQDSEDDPSGDR